MKVKPGKPTILSARKVYKMNGELNQKKKVPRSRGRQPRVRSVAHGVKQVPSKKPFKKQALPKKVSPPRKMRNPRPKNNKKELLGNRCKPEVPKATRLSAKSNKSFPEPSNLAKKPSRKRKIISDNEKETINANLMESKPGSGEDMEGSANGTVPLQPEVPKASRLSAKSNKSLSKSSSSGKMPFKKRKIMSANKKATIDASLMESKPGSEEDTEENATGTVPLQLNGYAEPDDTTEIEAVSGRNIGAQCVSDSRQQGLKTFQWLIAPYSPEVFFNNYWEKQPLYIQRKDAERNYFNGIFSTVDFDDILRKHQILFSKNLDITSYTKGQRETHNPVGQAHPPVVWDYYNNGCSIRMLNPQTFHRPVWKLLYSLQEYFNCFCGANVYLTPPDTQGFAPHWDDIEAFILQLEGKKHWKVYKPRKSEEELPVYSSKNLSQEEVGQPILEVTLKPGDVLYFPRGYIHQGQAVDGEHSLHITVSTYQRNTWGHYLEKLLPQAVSAAMAEDVEFRSGLPRDYLDTMGIVNMDVESPGRHAFVKKVEELVMRLLKYAPLDAAVDQRGANFMHDALPPVLTPAERERCARMGGERWCPKMHRVMNRVELDPSIPVRLIRGNCIRVVAEGDSVNLYHCLENTREYHQEDPQFLEVALEQAPAIEALLQAYPNYIAIENLPLADDTEKMNLANGLWERGLLMTAHTLDAAYDD